MPPAGREGFEDALLTRLVALYHERAAEEKRGLIRWLRPDYQSPATGPDAAALAGHFGKRTKPRIQQISEILETLTALGKL